MYPKVYHFVVLRSPPKWLHIVLDIHSILRQCVEKATKNRMSLVNDVKLGIHLPMVSTIIKPTAIFKCLRLFEFLNAISKFVTYIIIWSLMKRSIIEEIVNYSFLDLPPLFNILGHSSFQKIETSRGNYLNIIGGSKEINLNILSEALFIGSTCIDRDNTILIDDSPKKCVCNEIGKSLFLHIWTRQAFSDDFLLIDLALWSFQLHTNYNLEQHREYVNRNQIEIRLLAAYSKVLLHIANGMALSSRSIHAKYKILSVLDFVIPNIK
jgi:hypothetical protein